MVAYGFGSGSALVEADGMEESLRRPSLTARSSGTEDTVFGRWPCIYDRCGGADANGGKEEEEELG